MHSDTFNNNDRAENTSLLYCRVINVGGCSWEGASRFVKIHGCYFRNCGSIAIGNVRGRSDYLNTLGTGQHIITDNYFENDNCYGAAMIQIASAASQVIVSNNNFTNFNANAIWLIGECGPVDTPCENLIVRGNIIDMTAAVAASKPRFAVKITAHFAAVSDNQIYVRGQRDEKFKGIIISDDAARISVHDNTIAGAGVGIQSENAVGKVGLVSGETTFFAMTGPAVKPMLLRRLSDLYRGWHLVWDDGSESEIEYFDPVSTEFKLTQPKTLTEGDSFRIYHPSGVPWSIHHNIIDNCAVSLALDTCTGRRAYNDSNLIS
ncbi:MAG: right-handed parallel beta-helix repeat-containing protein [Clostridia bacterium]|nr:right-handed parallel beta-helix repeat-containing protein [Clostridia bacterium]